MRVLTLGNDGFAFIRIRTTARHQPTKQPARNKTRKRSTNRRKKGDEHKAEETDEEKPGHDNKETSANGAKQPDDR